MGFSSPLLYAPTTPIHGGQEEHKRRIRLTYEEKERYLPVSAFAGYEDGTSLTAFDSFSGVRFTLRAFPAGTTAYEKRGVATVVPEWKAENCIQCNQCSLICPHAAIRPCVMTDEEMKKVPESMKAIDVKMPNVAQGESRGSSLTLPSQSNVTEGKELAGMHFRMQVSAMDCTGCGWYACEHRLIKYTTVSNCADVCPAKEKALVMKPFLTAFDLFSGVRFTLRAFESQLHEAANWDYAQKPLFTASLSDGHWQSFSYKDNLIDKFASQRPRTPLNKSNLVSNVKNSQLSAEPTAYHAQPLFELLTAFD